MWGSAAGWDKMDRTSNALFLDSVRLTHLGTEAAVEAEAEDPCPFSVTNFLVTRTALRSIWASDRRPTVKVEVGCHPIEASVISV